MLFGVWRCYDGLCGVLLCGDLSMWRVSAAMCLWCCWDIMCNWGLGVWLARKGSCGDCPCIGRSGTLVYV